MIKFSTPPRFSALLSATASLALGAGPAHAGEMVRAFDVAEDHTRFQFDEAPVFEYGMPTAGNPFVAPGYIYPAEFLDGRDGVTEGGEPAFPDEVLGTWTCDGWFIRDGAHTEQGTWLVSRQVYHFDESDAVFVSQGPKYVEVGGAHPVTGATGAYSGEDIIEQTFLGFHERGGVKVRFENPGA